MRAGLIASLAAHTALLTWGLIAFPDAESFETQQVESLPVDLIPVEEFTQLRLGERTAEEIRDVAALQPADTPDEEPPQPADKPGEAEAEQPTPPTPSPPEPAPAPEPEPEPVVETEAEPAPAPPPAPTPEPEPVAEPEPAPEPELQEAAPAPQPIVTSVAPRSKPTPPRRSTQPPRDDFNSNQIAALLNKVEPAQRSGNASQDPASLGSRQGGQNVRMTQSELDALRGQVAQCWNPPVGAVGAEDLKVRVQFNLTQNGDVSGSPQVLNSSGNPAFGAASSSAIRAIMRCAPYSLPIAKYEAWQEVIINFDPREMLGG